MTCNGPQDNNNSSVSGPTRRLTRLARIIAERPISRLLSNPASVNRVTSPCTVLSGALKRRARSLMLYS